MNYKLLNRNNLTGPPMHNSNFFDLTLIFYSDNLAESVNNPLLPVKTIEVMDTAIEN